MQNKKLIFLIVLAGILIGGCQKELMEESSVTDQIISKQSSSSYLNIPYSDSNTLGVFKGDNEIVDYQLARKIAMLEVDGTGFLEEMQWEGHALSKLPVVIYGFDSKPKYYEFFYKDAEGKEVGSVTVLAKKKASTVIQEVRGTVRDYDALYSKSGADMTLIADWTGNIYMGLVGKSGDSPSTVIDPETGERVEGMSELSDEEILDEVVGILENQEQQFNLSVDSVSNVELKEEIENESISLDQQIDSLHASLEIEHAERDAFWEVLEEYSDSLIVLTDEEITGEATKGWFSRLWRRIRNVFKDETKSKYELSDYKSDFLSRGSSYIPTGRTTGGWCGPWAMDWIYHVRKGGSKYNHFESWASTLGPVGWVSRTVGAKPMFASEMNVSMGRATGYDIWVSPYYSIGRWNALYHIRYKKNPIVILTTSGKSMHWKVGYGCYRTGNVLWRNYYFACQDNGALKIDSKNHYHRSSWFMVFVKVYD